MKLKKQCITGCIFFLVVFSLLGSAQEKSEIFQFTLAPGPYAAGFKNVNLYDYSRTYYAGYDNMGNPVKECARPLQTSIWYPARRVAGSSPMIYKDYLHLIALEESFQALTPELGAAALQFLFTDWDINSERQAEVNAPCRGIRNGEPVVGTFPIIIYAPSMNSVSMENEALCEYLASYGYIVAASPSMGSHVRYVNMELADAETQARDVQFLLGYMQDFPNGDRDNVALMGFSRGGMAVVLAAMRDSRVKALIALDPSVRDPKHILPQSPDYDPDCLTMPSLFVISKEIPDHLWKKFGLTPPEDKSFKFYEDLKYSDAYLLQFHKLIHHNFSSGLIRFMPPSPDLSSPYPEVNSGYGTMCRYIHHFLEAHVRHNAEGRLFMNRTPEQNGIPAGTMSGKFKKGLEYAPLTGEFLYRARQSGLLSIEAEYERLKQKFPQFSVSSDILLNYGSKLFSDGKLDEAEVLFKLTVKIAPKEFYGFYGLATVYEKRGDIPAAIAAFQEALKVNPRMISAQEQIDRLQKKK